MPLDFEPESPDRMDQRGRAELAAELGDIAVDDVGDCGVIPDRFDRGLAGDHGSRIADQQREQVALPPGQLYGGAIGSLDDSRRQIQGDVREARSSPPSWPRRDSARRRATTSSIANGFTT